MRQNEVLTAKKSKKKAGLAIAGIAGAAALVGAGCASTGSQQSNAGDPTAPSADAASYKDGTYEALGAYRSPAGEEQIDVTLTLKNNVVTDATVKSLATMPRSMKYQGLFVSGFKDQVVGKNINDISLTWVSGSSLTPKGFNDALAKIKAQAAS